MQRIYMTFGSKPKIEAFPCPSLRGFRQGLRLPSGSYKPILFLSIISVSIFAAGIVDMTFPDVVPVRPYSSFFYTIVDFKSSSTSSFVFPLFLFSIAVFCLLTLVLRFPIFVPLTQKAMLHPNARRTADRHKDYTPLRNASDVTQITERAEDFIAKRKEEFEKRRKKRNERMIGEEILWQD